MKKETKHFLERNFRSARRSASFDAIVSSAVQFFEEVDSAFSLRCALALRYKDYSLYLESDVDPSLYDNAWKFQRDYQCAKLLSKAEFFPRVFDTKKKAQESFIQSELLCHATNTRFIERDGPDFLDHELREISYLATRKISSYLGVCPSVEELNFRFGPGNNVGLSRNTSIIDKLSADITYTSNLTRLLPRILSQCPTWVASRLELSAPTLPASYFLSVREVSGSELGFVPKNAKTDRAICTEPLLNSFVQLGVGRYMRSRLRRAGCNLNTQTRNQELARVGSITGKLATIDLSSASDTISCMTVLELLPFPWFCLLDDCRSHRYTYEGTSYNFEKFSSMGNGFTFELESLIFLALARATCSFLKLGQEDVSVYGDDIIIPVDAVALFRRVLTHFGFKVNESKSFSTGPFRESCGKDWFLGVPVRPLFLKRRPSNATLMGWCNFIMRQERGIYDPAYQKLYDGLYGLVHPAYYQLKGPDGYGDGHFISYARPDVLRRFSQRKRGFEGWGYYTLSSSSRPFTFSNQMAYAGALYSAQSCGQGVSNRASLKGLYVASRRGKVRTVLRQAFHPWNTG